MACKVICEHGNLKQIPDIVTEEINGDHPTSHGSTDYQSRKTCPDVSHKPASLSVSRGLTSLQHEVTLGRGQEPAFNSRQSRVSGTLLRGRDLVHSRLVPSSLSKTYREHIPREDTVEICRYRKYLLLSQPQDLVDWAGQNLDTELERFK
ncbi:hypothetical protein RRG08_021000, partial [Elysia crispata]